MYRVRNEFYRSEGVFGQKSGMLAAPRLVLWTWAGLSGASCSSVYSLSHSVSRFLLRFRPLLISWQEGGSLVDGNSICFRNTTCGWFHVVLHSPCVPQTHSNPLANLFGPPSTMLEALVDTHCASLVQATFPQITAVVSYLSFASNLAPLLSPFVFWNLLCVWSFFF